MTNTYLLLIVELDAWDNPHCEVGIYSEREITLPSRCMTTEIMRVEAKDFEDGRRQIVEAVHQRAEMSKKARGKDIWTWLREQVAERYHWDGSRR